MASRQVIDSRGNPTVEAQVTLEKERSRRCRLAHQRGKRKRSSCATETKRWMGKGVSKAVGNISKTIAPELLGRDAFDQVGIDQAMIELDGTKPRKARGQCDP